MSRQKRQGTSPELALRRALFARGHRYRVGWRVPDRPRRSIDVCFLRQHVAVFVDGCFWHSCPEHATRPSANGQWWAQKLQRNVERDRETDALLRAAGWTVIRIWEHEDTAVGVAKVERGLRRSSWSGSG